jgi:L-2-hydroxyglutarate oxidase LhgO
MEQVDCVVIGAGVVGLAIARQLAMAGREVLICEAEGQIGQHCSSRNSEVIHAGLYYPTGSLKARLCVQGRAMLYRYCAERHIRTSVSASCCWPTPLPICPLAGHCPTRRRQWRG